MAAPNTKGKTGSDPSQILKHPKMEVNNTSLLHPVTPIDNLACFYQRELQISAIKLKQYQPYLWNFLCWNCAKCVFLFIRTRNFFLLNKYFCHLGLSCKLNYRGESRRTVQRINGGPNSLARNFLTNVFYYSFLWYLWSTAHLVNKKMQIC